MRQLLKKDNEWTWSECHEEAFLKVKKELAKPPILAFYDPNLPIMLQTDAARLKGLGFACMQKHKDSWRLVDCGSRFLTAAETRYATIELEMLAIAYAVKKCRRFLAGRQQFDVITDHKPLIPIVNSKGLNEIENPRLQRLRESIIQYNPVLIWRKGRDHTIPDALSRSPVDVATIEDEIAEQEAEEQIHTVVMSNIYAIYEDEHQDKLLEEIHKHSSEDPEYQLLMKTILTGFPDNNDELDPIIRPYAKMKDLLCIDDNLIVCGQRLLIPKIMRKDILARLHMSHQGIERTRRRTRQSVYWPGINNDVENAVQSCQECQELLPSLQKEPMLTDEEPTRPFQVTSADYFDHAGKDYLIYTDRLSGWPMVQMFTRGATAVKLLSTLRNFFSATGVPEILRSDNGPQFNAGITKKFLQRWAVRHNTSSPTYAQSNGHAESSVKQVKHLIIKCTKNGNMDTDEFALGLLELRNTPKQNGQSPAQMIFGHPIRSNIPVHKLAYQREWQKNESECQERREKYQRYAETRYNLNAKPLLEFKIGTHVNVQDDRTGRWTNTGTITEIGRNRQYLIRKKNGRSVWRNRRFIRKHYPTISTPVTANYDNHENPMNLYLENPRNVHPITPPNSPRQAQPYSSPINPARTEHPSLLKEKVPVPAISPQFKSNNKMPSTNAQGPMLTRRTRQPPARLTLDPKQKTYREK